MPPLGALVFLSLLGAGILGLVVLVELFDNNFGATLGLFFVLVAMMMASSALFFQLATAAAIAKTRFEGTDARLWHGIQWAWRNRSLVFSQVWGNPFVFFTKAPFILFGTGPEFAPVPDVRALQPPKVPWSVVAGLMFMGASMVVWPIVGVMVSGLQSARLLPGSDVLPVVIGAISGAIASVYALNLILCMGVVHATAVYHAQATGTSPLAPAASVR